MPELAASRREVLDDAAAALGRAGFAEPRREALRLWAEIAPGAGEALVLDPDRAADVADQSRLRELVRRRIAGEPFAYVVGRAGFRRLVLRSDRRALIPRPETEGLVDLLLGKVRSGRAADVGTGSGCLALSLATEGDFGKVIATDLA
ncbi:MAG TPA: hypothetical protein VFI77_05995, partial [Gemmatimonadales bacterium]|nr:hypothetical protein [Gemmatimonadales bacterium]